MSRFKVKCSVCLKRIGTEDQYCGFCGQKNEAYDDKFRINTSRAEQRDRRHFYMVLALLVAGCAAVGYCLVAVVGVL